MTFCGRHDVVRYAVLHKTGLDTFVELLKIGPVQARAHVTIMAPGYGAFGFDDRLYVSRKCIGLWAVVLREIVRDTRLKRDRHERD